MSEHDLKKCECGCGGVIEPKPHHKYQPQRFLPGHHRGHSYVPKPEEIPSGLCECGCGSETSIATVTLRNKRHFRGYPVPFVHGHTKKKPSHEHHLWKGGRFVHKTSGYVYVHAPAHPDANSRGYVLEHRLVMEEKLGRRLSPDEYVHHMNHVRADNRPENLMLLSKEEHQAEHHTDRQTALAKWREENPGKLSEFGRTGAASRWSRPRYSKT